MHIIINNSQSIKKDPNYSTSSFHSRYSQEKAQKERRKNKNDRRKSVRDGVIVQLSVKHDRRKGRDRRKSNF